MCPIVVAATPDGARRCAPPCLQWVPSCDRIGAPHAEGCPLQGRYVLAAALGLCLPSAHPIGHWYMTYRYIYGLWPFAVAVTPAAVVVGRCRPTPAHAWRPCSAAAGGPLVSCPPHLSPPTESPSHTPVPHFTPPALLRAGLRALSPLSTKVVLNSIILHTASARPKAPFSPSLLLKVVLNSVILGIAFARIAHPKNRGRTVLISDCAVIARRNGMLKLWVWQR